MTYNAPYSPSPLDRPKAVTRDDVVTQDSVLTAGTLRALGVSAAEADRRCRAGGPWQLLLPGVYLLRAGPPVPTERLRAALLYAGRHTVPAQAGPSQAGSTQAGPDRHGTSAPPIREIQSPPTEAQITGLAALALHGFRGVPALPLLEHVDILVPHTRRLRSTGFVRVLRTPTLPEPDELAGLPVAPAPRALTDAAQRLTDWAMMRELLTEAVRAGHCEASTLVAELDRAGLLRQPEVAGFAPLLLAEGRAISEGHLYEVLRSHELPEPCWNVDLRLPDGPPLGGLDAYWPEPAVALDIDTQPSEHGARRPAHSGVADDPPATPRETPPAYKHAALERLGITVVSMPTATLRDRPDVAAAIVRTALMAAEEREPAAHVEVLPR